LLLNCQGHLAYLTADFVLFRSPLSQVFHPTFKEIPMSWTASVVTSATTDTEPSLVVSFDNAKYIFNLPENSNRAFTQKKAHRKSTRAFFLTQVGAQRAGGVAGADFICASLISWTEKFLQGC
jgi:hypothetical protein